MPAVAANVTFRAASDIAPALAARGDSMSATALRDLRRYYEAIDLALRDTYLSRAQWMFLRDILNGSFVDANLVSFLGVEVEDADDETAAKWGLNRHDRLALAQQLRELPPFTRLAILDSVERWWREQG